jgi:putative membrane protein
MTIVMKWMHRRLPRTERYPLPPRQITVGVSEAVGLKQQLSENERSAVTLASHFAYGALSGGIYGVVSEKISGHPAVKGVAFGLFVWSGSYLVGLPALGLLRTATQQPARRNALMIVAHVVWGVSLGLFHAALQPEEAGV